MTTFAGNKSEFSTVRLSAEQYRNWLRSWYGSCPCPEGLPTITLPDRVGGEEVVREGYGSLYRFADQLRQLAGNENAAVLAVPCDLQGGTYRGRVYFCWNPETGILALYRVG